MNELKCIKRDGKIVKFDWGKIQSAIESAYMDVYEGSVIDLEVEQIMNNLYEEVVCFDEDYITVEEIQKYVVSHIEYVNKIVAKAYEDYMNERTRVRESKSNLVKEIMGLIDNTNIDVLTENSNKQSQLASTQRDLIAGEVSKHIAKTTMIPKHLMDAHYQGIIKIHK